MHRDERRLLTYIALLLAALLALGGWLLRGHVAGVLARDSQVQVAFLDLALRDRSRFLGESLSQQRGAGGWPEDISDTLTRNHADFNRDIFMQVFETDGTLVAASSNAPAGLPLSPAAPGARLLAPAWHSHETTDPAGRAVRLVTYPVHTGLGTEDGMVVLGYAQAGLYLPETDRAVARFTWRLGALLLGVALLFGAGLRAAVLASAGRSRREMAAIQAAQHRFIGDAAHELGTPLAILQGEIDIALRRDRDSGDYRRALESCREEIGRLSRLSENLLALATADSGQELLHRGTCDAAEIARKVHGRFARVAEEKGVLFFIVAPDELPWTADAIAVEQILGNLVGNALRHTPADERVTLSVSCAAGEVVFEVEDRGEGIPAAHLPRLFERFHRVDKARSRVGGGAGLGLAIVKTLVEAHGGTVTAESGIGRGSRFTVRMPLAGHG